MISKYVTGVLGLFAFGSWIGYAEGGGNVYFLYSAIFFFVFFLGGVYQIFKDIKEQ